MSWFRQTFRSRGLPSGLSASAMALWPCTSSGDLGSSIHSGRQGASSRIHVTACPTSQRWFASTVCGNGMAARQHHQVHAVCLECECVLRCSLVTGGQALRQQLCYCSDTHTNVLCSPISLRMIASRRLSFSTSAPTFTLNLKLDEYEGLWVGSSQSLIALQNCELSTALSELFNCWKLEIVYYIYSKQYRIRVYHRVQPLASASRQLVRILSSE